MKKTILFSNGEAKEMTFEEVLKQFEGMVNKTADSARSKIVYNKPEREDLIQELNLQVWEAYKRYNGENAFSTYLYYRLQHGVHKATMKMYAQKRTNEHGSISIDSTINNGDGDEQRLEEVLGQEDNELMSIDFKEFINELEKNLNDNEKMMLTVLIDRKSYPVRDLADKLGISRQAANKRVNQFRDKMAEYMRTTGYVTC